MNPCDSTPAKARDFCAHDSEHGCWFCLGSPQHGDLCEACKRQINGFHEYLSDARENYKHHFIVMVRG